ncbi:MAG: hypothetical protein J4215_03120 [Candidatus Diapherotrites archaeon]|uniref:Uncharacterized protein n=1 Tax=Candidatus Iainarchaeum sp. TaxID=3101447 RepID=A0A8T4L4R9_9ARCH|nr:hypothetical protein [Candidatus Diapherotrites archaeon]
MKNHDSKQSADALRTDVETVLKSVSPEFHSLSVDLNQILKVSNNPAVVSALLFKLVQERQETNKLLSQLNEKYDQLMFEWKTQKAGFSPLNPLLQSSAPSPETRELKKNLFEVLPEQDQMILTLVDQKGKVDAEIVKASLGYKGLNAACQRLNKLFKEGYLKKIQSGKKVVYLANH